MKLGVFRGFSHPFEYHKFSITSYCLFAPFLKSFKALLSQIDPFLSHNQYALLLLLFSLQGSFLSQDRYAMFLHLYFYSKYSHFHSALFLFKIIKIEIIIMIFTQYFS
jgi:hypothetical protein